MLSKPQSCNGCPLNTYPFNIHKGFSTPEWGAPGVLLVGEALGEEEEIAGTAFVGKSGQYLFSNLQRVGVERSDVSITNTLWCRPPNNKLVGMPYEAKAIGCCTPNLDGAIQEAQTKAVAAGRTFVIVTLGKTAFKRVMGFQDKDPVMLNDYLGYPFWHHTYKAWVLAADHPSYLMRGNHHLVSILQWTVKRAIEIRDNGLELQRPTYLLDPTPVDFSKWVDEALSQPGVISYDIETPFKQGSDEEEVSKTDDEDYTILRCSFAWKPGHAVSVPWRAEFISDLRRLFLGTNTKMGWNNCPTPDQQVLMADLSWKAAGNLEVGDRLVGFEETPSQRSRRYNESVITNLGRAVVPAWNVTISDGTVVRVSGEHPWLVKPLKGARRNAFQWIATNNLKPGMVIHRLFPKWTPNRSFQAGYLAGIFDGEGWIARNGGANTIKVSAAQNKGPVLDAIKDSLNDLGYTYRLNFQGQLGTVVISGTKGDTAKFLGEIRPHRLLRKFNPGVLGSLYAKRHNDLTIRSCVPVGDAEVVQIATSTHTYILEGFAAHNCNYDEPRVIAATGQPLGGDQVDCMLAWHVLNSALPKSLGFVTPFYAKNVSMWKHLSQAEPAFYNAKDADMALQIWLGVEKDLKDYKLWDVFDRHVVKLNRIFSYMSSQGVRMDLESRDKAEATVSKMLADVQAKMEATIPPEARALKIFKKTPKALQDLENEGIPADIISSSAGYIRVNGTTKTPCCPRCNVIGAKAAHFKSIGKKRLKAGEPENPCVGLKAEKRTVPSLLWAKPLEFKISPLSLSRYQQAKGHRAIIVPDRNHATRTKRVTFDEKAILKLTKNYPKDPLYPIILEFRGLQKLLSTYIGVTEYEQVEVTDDYELKPGEKLVAV